MVDQPGCVEIDVLDEDRAPDDPDGVLACGGVREVHEVGGGLVVVSNIQSRSRTCPQFAISVLCESF
eukprot:1113545-Prorocentrum_minimum.AAC.1